MTRTRTLVVVLLVTAAATLGVVQADVRGNPDLDASLPDNRVTPGEDTTLEVSLTNTGRIREADPQNSQLTERVMTARGVDVELGAGDAPIEVRTESRAVGSIPDGTSTPVAFDVSVDENADPGTYQVPVTVSYEYTGEIDDTDGDEVNRLREETLSVRLEVRDDARVEVLEVSTDARVGSTGTVAVTAENTGTGVAEDATLQLEASSGDISFGGSATATRAIGQWEPDETRTLEYETTVAETGEPQPYAADVSATYRDENGRSRTSETSSVALRPQPQQTFSVLSTDSTVAVDDSGTLTVELRNDGPIAVSDATVDLSATSPSITFEGSSSTSRFVGPWQPNETRTVAFDAGASGDADTRSYTVEATVDYRDSDGDRETAPARSLGVVPDPEQSFDIGDVASNLTVGSEGTLRGTVTNTGEEAVTDAVVRFVTDTETVTALESESPVGDLAAGDSAAFSIPLEISESAEEGPKQYELQVQYRNQDGDQRETDTTNVRQTVGPDDPEFDLSANGSTVEPGGQTRIDLTVTNAGDSRLTDISANLFADDPVSTVDDEAFVSGLDPGESRTITFTVGAGGGASPKDYPLSLDFQYDEPDGDTVVSDTYKFPLTVEESEDDGGLPVWAFVLVGAVLLGLGVVAYRRYG